jgi:hypothetical protein
MNGDGLYANENTPTAGSATAWPTDIWFHDSSIDTVGRNAFTINSGRRVTLERNVIDHVGGSVLDIEPDLDTQGAVDLILRNNTVATWGMSPQYTMHFVACANNDSGIGAVIQGITITGNRVTQGAPNSAATRNAGGLSTWIGKTRTSDVSFTDNVTTRAGAGPALRFEHVDGLTVTGNVQPLTSGTLTSISDSTDVYPPPPSPTETVLLDGLALAGLAFVAAAAWLVRRRVSRTHIAVGGIDPTDGS